MSDELIAHPLLVELKDLVKETLPFLVIEDCEGENLITKQQLYGIRFSLEENVPIIPEHVYALVLFVEDENLLIEISASGRPNITLAKPLQGMPVTEALSFVHVAFSTPS